MGLEYAEGLAGVRTTGHGADLDSGMAEEQAQHFATHAYAASKGAVVTLTKSLALECAPHGVRVVAIAPVATETPMLPTFMGKERVDAEGMARYVATVPLGRLNQPDDLARTAVFLASDDAAMITGSCVEVDGGRCI